MLGRGRAERAGGGVGMRSSGRGRAQRAEGELRRESGDVIVGLGLTVGLGPCPLLCLFYSFYFLFLFISSLWHMGKASPCSPRRPPRRRLALQTGSLAVPRLNALRTEVARIDIRISW